jgi:hypothetical protein
MKTFLIPLAVGLAFAGNLHAQSAETIGNSPAPAFIGAPDAAATPPQPNAVVFNNGPLVNSPGTGPGGSDESLLQNSTLGMGTFGFNHSAAGVFRVADDFTVPGGGWNITNVTLYAYQTGSTTTSTITSVTLRIWNGVPGAAGSSVVFGDTTTNRLTNSTWSGIYRGLLSAPGATNRPVMANTVAVNTVLPAGTYWMDWNTGGSLASGPWAPPVTINGQATTGNGLQFDGAAWNPADDGDDQQAFPFVIEVADAPAISVSTLSRDGLLLLGLLLAIGGAVMVVRRS